MGVENMTFQKRPIMSMQGIQLLTIWFDIALVIAALLFVPYGYSEYKSTTDFTNATEASITTTQHIPWKYVGYAFIFKIPRNDPVLDEIDEQVRKSGNVIYSYTMPSMRIWWGLVVIEFVIIQLFAAGVFLTTRILRSSSH
jgi:hypothetical protein